MSDLNHNQILLIYKDNGWIKQIDTTDEPKGLQAVPVDFKAGFYNLPCFLNAVVFKFKTIHQTFRCILKKMIWIT